MATHLPPAVAQYLERHHVMTLATCSLDGPWASAVFYVHIGPALYFLSSPSSRHCRNLAHDPRCAATVQEDYSDWTQIKGLQLEGHAHQVQGDEEVHARHCYANKFPLVGRLDSAPARIVAALAKIRWYRLQVARMHFIDNSQGFGHREPIDLGREP
jgi:uncharacterized protein